MSTITNRQWRLAARPVGRIKESDYSLVEEPLPELADGQLRVRVDYLSLDPANRGWLNEGGSYMAAIPLGAVMPAMGIGTVDESRNPSFKKGDLVQGMPGWQRVPSQRWRGPAETSAGRASRDRIWACSDTLD
jgi:NADPH-dependent curcumin reductase CurA